MIRRIFSIGIGSLLFLCIVVVQQANAQITYQLKPGPKTVAWGYYDAKAAPVLRVKSGDTVEIQTLITNSPKRLEDAGLPPAQVEQSLRDIALQVAEEFRQEIRSLAPQTQLRIADSELRFDAIRSAKTHTQVRLRMAV